MMRKSLSRPVGGLAAGLFLMASPMLVGPAQVQEKRPMAALPAPHRQRRVPS